MRSSLTIKEHVIIILLAIFHLFVDLICGFKVVGILGHQIDSPILSIFIIYNSIAFIGQIIMGLIVDKVHYEKLFLIGSTILLFIGLMIPSWLGSIILLGLGNQIFHVAGGKICTNITVEKAYPLGIFVSLGAVGLTIGSLAYKNIYLGYISIIIIVLITIALFILTPAKSKDMIYINKVKPNKQIKLLNLITFIIFLSLVVFIRSFLGKIIHYDAPMTTILLWLFPICGAFGKLIGGFLKDFFGSLPVIIISMVVMLIMLLGFNKQAWAICIGMIMINISMPITLYELNRLNPKHEGLNFGILASVLFPGVFLGIVYKYTFFSYIAIMVISASLTIISIYLIQKKVKVNG